MARSSSQRYSSAESAQEVYQAAQLRSVQTRRKIADRGPFPDFRQSRIRHHNSGHGADIESARERERPGRDQLARLRPDDGRSEDAAILRRNDLDVAVGFPLGLRPVIVVIGPAQHADLLVAPARLWLRQPAMR